MCKPGCSRSCNPLSQSPECWDAICTSSDLFRICPHKTPSPATSGHILVASGGAHANRPHSRVLGRRGQHMTSSIPPSKLPLDCILLCGDAGYSGAAGWGPGKAWEAEGGSAKAQEVCWSSAGKGCDPELKLLDPSCYASLPSSWSLLCADPGPTVSVPVCHKSSLLSGHSTELQGLEPGGPLCSVQQVQEA